MDRDLLIGILAWRRGWVAHDALVAAIEEYVRRPGSTLAAILVERQLLLPDRREQLARDAEGDATQLRAAAGKLDANDAAWVALRQSVTSLAGPRAEATLSLFDDGVVTADLDDSPASVAPGMVVEATARFEVVRMHARGGLGEVHLAREQGVPREVALKEIQPQYLRDGECRRRFVCEAEVTGSLEHPGIVPVYALGRHDDGRPFYVMRFIAGQNLGHAIKEYHSPTAAAETSAADPAARELAFRKLLDRYLDVCQTIAYAHSRGVLHRDLKPDNVMLGAYGETLVVDWGLAKRLEGGEAEATAKSWSNRPAAPDAAIPNAGPPPGAGDKTVAPDATRLGTIIGTPAFMSPEQALGWHDRLGPAADVFSLGAILYMILTGRPAASGTTVHEVLQKAQAGEFPRPSTLVPHTSAALEAICLKAMAKSATDRYTGAGDLAADIEAYLADQPVTAYPEPWHATLGRWIRRHRTWAIGIGAGGGVLVACLIVGLVMLSGFNEELRVERDRATTNFGLAQSAVERYLVRVSHDPRLKTVGLENLRRDLLREAGTFYEEFIRREGKQAKLQLDLAKAHFFLGEITAEIDSTAEGVKKMEQALAIQQELAAREPENGPAVEFGMAIRNDMANLLVQLGRREEAAVQYLAVERILTALPPTPDAEKQRNRTLFAARGQHNIGLAYHYMDRRKEARTAYERAAQSLAALVDPAKIEAADAKLLEDPLMADVARLVARNSRELGLLDHEEGRLPEARAGYRRATKLFTLLADNRPADAEHVTDLAGMHLNEATIDQEQFQYESGLKHCAAGLARLAPLRAAHPDIDLYQAVDGKLLNTQAALLWRSGRPGEALADSARSISLRRELAVRRPEQYEYRLDLGNALYNDAVMRVGGDDLAAIPERLREAIQLHEQLAKGQRDPSEHRYQLARDHDVLGAYYARTGDQRRALAEREVARQELGKVVKEFPEVPYYRETLITVQLNYAVAANALRLFAAAHDALTAAEQQGREQVRRHPENLAGFRLLARIAQLQGQTASEEGEPQEALQLLRSAVAQRQALAAKHSTVAELKRELAAARFTLAGVLSGAQRFGEAIGEYSDAADLYRGLLREPSAAADAEFRLAQTLYNRALVRWILLAEEEAIVDLETAIALGRKVYHERGGAFEPAIELAASHGRLAQVYEGQDRPLEMLVELNAAIDLLLAHRERLALSGLAQVTLRLALAARAKLWTQTGDYRLAAEDWGMAAALISGPTQIEYDISRIQSLNAAGEHEKAIAAGVALVKAHPEDWELAWKLAFGCASAMTEAEKSPRLSPEDRTKWAERYGAVSLETLAALHAAGQLTPARREVLKSDPRFEPLRKAGKLKTYLE